MKKSKGKNIIQKSKVWFLSSLVFTLTITSLFMPFAALAHETESDNGIGAILHVDPGDAPIAGQKSTLFFEFIDMEDKLDLNNCVCSAEITRDGIEVLKQDFTGASGAEVTSGVIEYTFPEAGMYKTVVTGSPKEGGQFKPFKLNFSTRVEKDVLGTISEQHERAHSTWVDHAKHYSIAVITIIFLGIALLATKHKKKIAVILLALVLISHLMPIKAIHGSHGGTFDSQGYECCLPTAVVLPDAFTEIETVNFDEVEARVLESKEKIRTFIPLVSRPPPLS